MGEARPEVFSSTETDNPHAERLSGSRPCRHYRFCCCCHVFLLCQAAADWQGWFRAWWTTTPPTRPPRPASGCSGIAASTCTSLPQLVVAEPRRARRCHRCRRSHPAGFSPAPESPDFEVMAAGSGLVRRRARSASATVCPSHRALGSRHDWRRPADARPGGGRCPRGCRRRPGR